jgi:RNA polymerase sigma factor (sigma-70 family)
LLGFVCKLLVRAAQDSATFRRAMTRASAVLAKDHELTWSDERLVKECLAGRPAAWSALIDKYKNLIFSIPVKYDFSREDSNDIFQSVCLDLLIEMPRLRNPQALAKWIIQTTSHKCLHWKRREQRYVAGEEFLDVPDQKRSARTEEIVREAQEEQVVRDAIAALHPRCAKLIRMLFFDTPTRTYTEIAAELGLATGSIGFIRGRCLDRLKKELLARGLK